ncbi:stalk domain-containing protein [Defluviitalea saccharophila]|uniref:Stalk domain-containing protein n=1 Tax=Defluviitalea saccharophila TaxID=879970 RepID=A0ABZ2Y895_9FIRM
MSKRKFNYLLFILTIVISFQTLAYGGVQRPTAKEIPNGSLIIGTHIISLKALNQSLLDIALKSGESEGQKDVYYKSEFANGTWYKITNADGIGDIISTSDKAVSEVEIDNLILTHWTKDDGKTIDLETGQTVNPSDIDSIRDPHNMEELKELVMEEESVIELLKQDDDDEDREAKNRFIKNSLGTILKEISTNDFNTQDNLLKLLENYEIYLRNEKKASEEEIGIVGELKEKIKTQRDYAAYSEVYNRIDQEAKKAQTKGYTDYTSKLLDKLDAVNKKISDLTNKLVESSMSPLDNKRNELCKALIENVAAKNFSGADAVLLQIFSIDNIKANRIVHLSTELSILDEVLGKELAALKTMVSQGEPKEYKEAKSRGERPGMLLTIKEEHVANIKDFTSNIATLKDYIAFRRSADDQKIAQLNTLIENLEGTRKAQPKSDVYDEVDQELREFIDKLKSELTKLQVKNSSELQAEKELSDNMQNQINTLKNKYLDAIEKGDMQFAEQIQNEMNALAEELEEKESQKLDELSQLLNQKNEILNELNKDPNNESLAQKLDEINLEIAKKQELIGEKEKSILELLDEAVNELKDAVKAKDLTQIEEAVTNILDLAKNLSPNLKVSLKNSIEGIIKDMNAAYIDLVKQNQLTQAEEYAALIEDLKEELGIGLDNEDKKAGTQADTGSQTGTGTQTGTGAQTGAGTQAGTGAQTEKASMNDLEKEISALEQKTTQTSNNRQRLMKRILILYKMKNTKKYVQKFGDLLDKKLNEEIKLLKSIDAEKYSEADVAQKERAIRSLIVINKKMKVLNTIQIISDTDSSKHLYAPVMRENLMLVCLRDIGEALGAKIKWIDYQQKAVITKGNLQMSCIVGSDKLLVNSVHSKTMPYKTLLIGERVYVPLNFVLNEMGYTSAYKPEHNMILIYSKKLEQEVQKVFK